LSCLPICPRGSPATKRASFLAVCCSNINQRGEIGEIIRPGRIDTKKPEKQDFGKIAAKVASRRREPA
jgi:hypothetical protein